MSCSVLACNWSGVRKEASVGRCSKYPKNESQIGSCVGGRVLETDDHPLAMILVKRKIGALGGANVAENRDPPLAFARLLYPTYWPSEPAEQHVYRMSNLDTSYRDGRSSLDPLGDEPVSCLLGPGPAPPRSSLRC